MKKKLLKFYYGVIYDIAYSIGYSFKSLFKDSLLFLAEFKKPQTWSVIMYTSTFIVIYLQRFDLLKWMLPAIVVIYILRQRIDGGYKKEIKDKAVIKDNDIILDEEYKKYTQDCYFKKVQPLPYDIWKEKLQEAIKA